MNRDEILRQYYAHCSCGELADYLPMIGMFICKCGKRILPTLTGSVFSQPGTCKRIKKGFK